MRIVVLLVVSVQLFTFCSDQVNKEQELKNSTRFYRVIRIIDGDTYKIQLDSEAINIRLIGVDTPESSNNFKTRADAERTGLDIEEILEMGREATNFIKSFLSKDDSIRIELDVQTNDRYGRLLCYAYLTNGEMINEKILKNGYGQVMTVPPNIKYEEKFLEAQQFARQNQLGLWGDNQ